MSNKIQRHVPLSFQGNKSKHINGFIEYINKCPCQTYIDLFGGSCYLSYVIHQVQPQARVICNDYDNYCERLANIETTNQIIEAIKSITTSKPSAKYTPQETQQIGQIINEFKSNKRFIDCITLSRCLCFSGSYHSSVDELLGQTFYYNNLPQDKYNVQWYIDAIQGIEFVCKDWFELFNVYKGMSGICFIADSPYLGTDKASYSSKFWRLTDTLKTIQILKQQHFVYYSSNKSELIALIDYLNNEYEHLSPIVYETEIIERPGLNNSSKSWKDIMMHNK